MTQEEIKDYNERCAEFLGGTKEIDGWNFCMSDFGINVIGGYGFFDAHDLKFHSDWNWIMGIVEAIEKLNYSFSIFETDCLIQKNHKIVVVTNALKLKTKKEAVTKGIYKFLIQYNETRTN